MTPKERITERLQKMELLQGVVPTPAVRSEMLGAAARALRVDDVFAAARSASDHLKETQPDFSIESAAPLLSGSSTLREQLAGFADAGINLFHASKDLLDMSLSERGARGASAMVSRVLVSDQRILLETPRVIVRFKEGSTAADRKPILARHDVVEIDNYGQLPADTFKGGVLNGDAATCSLALMQEADVLYAEPDFIEHIGQRYRPTDPEFGNQWHHTVIQTEAAWDLAKGENVAVAVIDNGFDITHPDLQFGPMSGWFRPTPDLIDADFVPGTNGMLNSDHGTACAGMIAAKSGNGSGGCGVAFSSALSMVACGADQVGTQSTLARALAYAAGQDLLDPNKMRAGGADIIACSLGPNSAKWEMRQVLSDAIDFAATKGRDGRGCAIFWACTNGNYPIGSDEVCSHARVIAVGRSRQTDHDDGSGFGPQLEFLAPGVDVRIPASGGTYQVTTGTSFAAPCAAGVAALALARHPELTAAQLRQLMRDSCDKVGTLPYIDDRNPRFGHGRVNAKLAVEEAIRLAALA
ncbi:MAG: S8 family serine peptidase [Tardiphaga sp.]